VQLGLSKPQCRELGIPWTRDMHTISMRPLIYSKASLPTGLIKPQRKKLGGTQMHTLKGCRFKNCTPLSSALPSLWPSFCSLQTLSTHSLQTPSTRLVPCHKHLQIYMYGNITVQIYMHGNITVPAFLMSPAYPNTVHTQSPNNVHVSSAMPQTSTDLYAW